MQCSNNRSTVTKCGHSDGLTCHIRGWNKGIYVNVFVDSDGNEVYEVGETSGSNGGSQREHIKTIKEISP